MPLTDDSSWGDGLTVDKYEQSLLWEGGRIHTDILFSSLFSLSAGPVFFFVSNFLTCVVLFVRTPRYLIGMNSCQVGDY